MQRELKFLVLAFVLSQLELQVIRYVILQALCDLLFDCFVDLFSEFLIDCSQTPGSTNQPTTLVNDKHTLLPHVFAFALQNLVNDVCRKISTQSSSDEQRNVTLYLFHALFVSKILFHHLLTKTIQTQEGQVMNGVAKVK